MRLAALLLVTALLGGGVGFALTLSEFAGTPEEFGLENTRGAGNSRGSVPGQASVYVEGESTFDFGVMQRGEERSHTFVLRNEGSAPATLKQGETSCKCTLSQLEHDELPPGGKVSVTLTWHSDSYAPAFEQGAEIMVGNDPENPVITLRVKGRITQEFRPDPERLALGSLTTSESRRFRVNVFSYRPGEWEPGAAALVEPELAEYFEFSQEPLGESEISGEPGATGGVQLNVTVKSGLPLGPIQQTIRLPLGEGRLPLELPVEG